MMSQDLFRGLLLLGLLFSAGEAADPPRSGLIQPTALDRDVDAAVVRATHFLVSQQRPSGAWFLDLYQGEATSTTSLALMALLAAGHVPGEPPYGEVFHKGLDYLVQRQQPTGLIVDKTGHGPLYCHGISTLFLAEIVGMTEPRQSVVVRGALEKGVRALLEAQAIKKEERHRGGWRYTLRSTDSDLSVTAWQLLALRAARNAGCDVPAESIDLAVAYVRQCASRDGGFGYLPGGGMSTTMTAAGITALQVCGAAEQQECVRAIPILELRLPRANERYFHYGSYYSCVALHQAGGEVWNRRKDELFRPLLEQQAPDGSWLNKNDSEQGVGKVYGTALAVLALTVEYGYLPIYQK